MAVNYFSFSFRRKAWGYRCLAQNLTTGRHGVTGALLLSHGGTNETKFTMFKLALYHNGEKN